MKAAIWSASGLLAASALSGVVSGCANPPLPSAACANSPTLGVKAASKVAAGDALRNVFVVTDQGGATFVSAELVRAGATKRTRGPILTWAGASGGALKAVDANARRFSSWPASSAGDAHNASATTSRGCVYRYIGKTYCPNLGGGAGGLGASTSCVGTIPGGA